MEEPGRNDPCPCGSGKKFKHCCLKEEKMAEDTWEIDPLAMSLDDYIVLDRGLGVGCNPQHLKETLGRLVSNKTEEEIGALSMRDLNVALDSALKAFKAAALPKVTDTP